MGIQSSPGSRPGCRRCCIAVAGLLSVFAVACTAASVTAAATALHADLDRVFGDSRLQRADLGVCVADLGGTVLYERRADHAFMPASTMKLVTAAAALRTFNDGYRFPTTICADRPPDSAGTISGNLYITGRAHPTMDRGFLTRAAQRLAREGLRRVSGSIICGGPVTHASTATADAAALRSALQECGVTVDGAAAAGMVPAEAVTLHRWESDPVVTLLREMNKRSDNAIADGMLGSLLYRHNLHGDGAPHRLMTALWLPLGLDMTGCRFVDGSGLSRQNRLTPRFLVQLLIHMRRDNPRAGAFVNTLAVAGQDGTLRVRMVDTCAAGNVRAKTGFLTGASTLAGYTDANGRQLCFAIMMNNHAAPTTAMRDIQNRACVAMVQWSTRH